MISNNTTPPFNSNTSQQQRQTIKHQLAWHEANATTASSNALQFNLIDPTFIKSLGYGFNMVKRQGKDPSFEIWLGTNSIRDFIGSYNFSEAVKFLVKQGHCHDYKEAIKLLNEGYTEC